MSSPRAALLAAVLAMAASTGAAREPLGVRPGHWAVTVEPGGGATSVSYGVCLERGDWDDVRRFLPRLLEAPPGCTSGEYRVDGRTVAWGMRCSGANPVQARADFLIREEWVIGATRMVRGVPPQEEENVTRLEARRTGDCR